MQLNSFELSFDLLHLQITRYSNQKQIFGLMSAKSVYLSDDDIQHLEHVSPNLLQIAQKELAHRVNGENAEQDFVCIPVQNQVIEDRLVNHKWKRRVQEKQVHQELSLELPLDF